VGQHVALLSQLSGGLAGVHVRACVAAELLQLLRNDRMIVWAECGLTKAVSATMQGREEHNSRMQRQHSMCQTVASPCLHWLLPVVY
jgi:hypothetical protein